MKFEDIKELIELWKSEKDIDKVKIKDKDFEITIEKDSKSILKMEKITPQLQMDISNSLPNQPPESMVEKSTSQTSTSNRTTITSPMVGTFYAAPSPDLPHLLGQEENIRKGKTLCILEAMKIMNELEAEFDCKFWEILVQMVSLWSMTNSL